MDRLVTCAILGLLEDGLGGRPKTWEDRYIQGISHLRNNTWEKTVYISSYLKDNLNRALKGVCDDEQLSRYNIIPFDIHRCEFSNDVTRVVGENKNARSLHVQYGKFWFMNQSAGEPGNTYWIDAGLISSSLFPQRIFPSKAHEVITDTYLQNLTSRITDKVYVIVGNRKKGFTAAGDNSRALHPIGGFFGGPNNQLRLVLNRYNNIIRDQLSQSKAPGEEVIMEDDFTDNQQDYIFDEFDSWYHEDHMIEQYAQINNKKFYQTLTNI